MSANTPQEAMQQYIQPEYWDGHSIGIGQTVLTDSRYSSSAVRLAKQVVNTFLATNRAPYPLETYAAGTEVDSDQWLPGTLLYGRREYMRGNSISDNYSLETEVELPTPPTDLSFSPGEQPDLIGVDNLLYLSAKNFFVVANFGKEGNRLMPISMHDISIAASGVRRAIFVHPSLQKDFAVNRTVHTHTPKGFESLERINTLSLVSRGQYKKRSRVAERLANLRLAPQTN